MAVGDIQFQIFIKIFQFSISRALIIASTKSNNGDRLMCLFISNNFYWTTFFNWSYRLAVKRLFIKRSFLFSVTNAFTIASKELSKWTKLMQLFITNIFYLITCFDLVQILAVNHVLSKFCQNFLPWRGTVKKNDKRQGGGI